MSKCVMCNAILEEDQEDFCSDRCGLDYDATEKCAECDGYGFVGQHPNPELDETRECESCGGEGRVLRVRVS